MFRELETYKVGGAVRNHFLGKEAADNDYVVVATEEEFEKVFPDAERVGKTFPVYLHPITRDEVALTREEYSSGEKYQDFEIKAIGVPIRLDLKRRDFSVNSIAQNVITGEIIDPYNGVEDIKNKILKTINDNFVKEDPLRIYRLARFAAEFDFTIDKETADIVKRDSKYIKNVLPDRIYAELKKNYERSNQPSIFFRVLFSLDVLKYHFKPLYVASFIPAGPSKWHPKNHDWEWTYFPETDSYGFPKTFRGNMEENSNSVFDHLLNSFDNAKQNGHSFSVAIASLVHDFGKIITRRKELPKHHAHEFRGVKLIEKFFESHRFDAHTVELAKLASRHHMSFHYLTEIKKPVKLIRFYKSIKKMAEEVTQVATNDHGVSKEELEILNRLKTTFKTTVIDIPEVVKERGRESIVTFVEAKYVEQYKKL
jgi:tRNA nucleotidyltransferase (CCA-adding enzyme)